MVTLAQTFESGQSAGASVTAATSAVGGTAFSSVTVGFGGVLTYVAGTGARGALCMRYATGLLSAVPAYARPNLLVRSVCEAAHVARHGWKPQPVLGTGVKARKNARDADLRLVGRVVVPVHRAGDRAALLA